MRTLLKTPILLVLIPFMTYGINIGPSFDPVTTEEDVKEANGLPIANYIGVEFRVNNVLGSSDLASGNISVLQEGPIYLPPSDRQQIKQILFDRCRPELLNVVEWLLSFDTAQVANNGSPAIPLSGSGQMTGDNYYSRKTGGVFRVPANNGRVILTYKKGAGLGIAWGNRLGRCAARETKGIGPVGMRYRISVTPGGSTDLKMIMQNGGLIPVNTLRTSVVKVFITPRPAPCTLSISDPNRDLGTLQNGEQRHSPFLVSMNCPAGSFGTLYTSASNLMPGSNDVARMTGEVNGQLMLENKMGTNVSLAGDPSRPLCQGTGTVDCSVTPKTRFGDHDKGGGTSVAISFTLTQP